MKRLIKVYHQRTLRGEMQGHWNCLEIFGASPSPYILGATIERHLERCKEKYTDTINTLKTDACVHDI